MENCGWMFGDAATGVFGFHGLAHLNPWRWSGPIPIETAIAQLENVFQAGSRPIIIKMPATTKESIEFRTTLHAIEYLRNLHPGLTRLDSLSHQSLSDAAVVEEVVEELSSATTTNHLEGCVSAIATVAVENDNLACEVVGGQISESTSSGTTSKEVAVKNDVRQPTPATAGGSFHFDVSAMTWAQFLALQRFAAKEVARLACGAAWCGHRLEAVYRTLEVDVSAIAWTQMRALERAVANEVARLACGAACVGQRMEAVYRTLEVDVSAMAWAQMLALQRNVAKEGVRLGCGAAFCSQRVTAAYRMVLTSIVCGMMAWALFNAVSTRRSVESWVDDWSNGPNDTFRPIIRDTQKCLSEDEVAGTDCAARCAESSTDERSHNRNNTLRFIIHNAHDFAELGFSKSYHASMRTVARAIDAWSCEQNNSVSSNIEEGRCLFGHDLASVRLASEHDELKAGRSGPPTSAPRASVVNITLHANAYKLPCYPPATSWALGRTCTRLHGEGDVKDLEVGVLEHAHGQFLAQHFKTLADATQERFRNNAMNDALLLSLFVSVCALSFRRHMNRPASGNRKAHSHKRKRRQR